MLYEVSCSVIIGTVVNDQQAKIPESLFPKTGQRFCDVFLAVIGTDAYRQIRIGFKS